MTADTQAPTAQESPKSSKTNASAESGNDKTRGPWSGLRRLPEAVLKAQYVRRTQDILARRRERVAKLRADTRQDIREVFEEIDRDVRQGVERIEGTARKHADRAWKDFVKTPVGQRIDGFFSRKSKAESSDASESSKP